MVGWTVSNLVVSLALVCGLLGCSTEAAPAPRTPTEHPEPAAETEPAQREDEEPAARAPLEVIEHGTGDRALVLLHGYGSNAEDMEGFVRAADLGDGVRVVFPTAPNAWRGGGAGRAWFEPPRSRMHEDEGRTIREVASARAQIGEMLDALESRGVPSGQVVLGGFSQGAMMSLDFALHDDRALAGVAVLSGAPLPTWAPRYARRAGGHVFLSHGQRDDVLPFADAETMRDALRAAGANVEWVPFDDGHTLPAEIKRGLIAFTRARLAAE